MSDRHVAFAAVDQPLLLRVEGGGAALPATVREVSYIGSGGAVDEVQLECELSPNAYERVDREHLLHLAADVRGPGAERFAPPGSVRLTLRLADGAVARLLAAAPDPGAAAALLGEPGAAGDEPTPWLSAESWFALSVTASIAPPPEGAADGELSGGYATRWAARSHRLKLPMLVVAGECLEAHGWTYEELDDDTALGWRMSAPEGSWSSFAVARESERRFAVYSSLDDRIAEPLRADAAQLVARVNWGLPLGNWELDLDDGALRFKTSVELGGEPLSLATAARVIERNLAVTAAYVGAFSAFAARQATAREALALAEE